MHNLSQTFPKPKHTLRTTDASGYRTTQEQENQFPTVCTIKIKEPCIIGKKVFALGGPPPRELATNVRLLHRGAPTPCMWLKERTAQRNQCPLWTEWSQPPDPGGYTSPYEPMGGH